jgi:hypothetical protein
MSRLKHTKIVSSNERRLRNKLFNKNTSDEESREIRKKLKKYGWR